MSTGGRRAGSSRSSRSERGGHIQHLPVGAGRAGASGTGSSTHAPALASPPRRRSTTKVMRLSILAELRVEMNPEGNLELVTSACKPTVEEMQSTEELERSTLWFSLGSG